MIRRTWVLAFLAAALAVAVGSGCSSSSSAPPSDVDASCVGDGSVTALLSVDAGSPACQACVRNTCTADVTACGSDCTCNASALAAIGCIQGLPSTASASDVAACVSSNLPSGSDPALTQVGSCLTSCASACAGSVSAMDSGATDSTMPQGDSGSADSPVEASFEASPDVGSDAQIESSVDAPFESATDAPADASFIDAPLEQPDGGPPLYAVTTARLASAAREGAISDFDQDGNLDLAIAGADTTGVAGAVITLGDGRGGFVYETTVTGMGTTPEGITVGDFNKDGHQDIALAGFSEGPYVAYGKGDGTFDTAVDLSFSGEGGGGGLIESGDFNGDGYLDIAVGYDGGMFVLFNDRIGGFLPAVTAHAGAVFNRFAVGDMNGDGIADMGYGDNTLWLILANGDAGTFASTNVAGSQSNTRNVTFADLDGNGHLDVIASMSQGSASPLEVTLQRTNGTFQPEVAYGTNVDEPAVVADFDGDSKLDVAASTSSGSSVELFRGNGDGTLASPVNYPLSSTPAFILTADINKNGKPDIVAVTTGIYVTTLLQ